RPVPPEPEPGRSKGFGSDLATRVITGAVVAAGGLLVLNAGPGPASVLVALIVAFGVIELCGALRTQGYRPAAWSPCWARSGSCSVPTTVASRRSRPPWRPW